MKRQERDVIVAEFEKYIVGLEKELNDAKLEAMRYEGIILSK